MRCKDAGGSFKIKPIRSSYKTGLIIKRPTQAAPQRLWTVVPAEPYDFDSSHRTLAQILARLESYWSSGLISGTEKTLFFALGESTMAALRRTDDTEIAAVVARRKYEGEGWRKKGRGGGGRKKREEDPGMQTGT